jgi:hypothetical protein
MKGAGTNKADFGEMAKDVAAFANAAGGVIVVGVDHQNGAAQRYPLSLAEANELVELYSQAVRDRCSPRPLIEPCAIDIGPEPGKPPDERFVVAVNLWPYPDQPVGVTYSVLGKKGLPSDFGEATSSRSGSDRIRGSSGPRRFRCCSVPKSDAWPF